MYSLIWMFLVAVAIERYCEILTSVDFLEPIRARWERWLPWVGKLATCKYCQCFWMSAAAAYFLPFPLIELLFTTAACAFWTKFAVMLPAYWMMSLVIGEFMERYMNRAPMSVFLQKGEGSTGE